MISSIANGALSFRTQVSISDFCCYEPALYHHNLNMKTLDAVSYKSHIYWAFCIYDKQSNSLKICNRVKSDFQNAHKIIMSILNISNDKVHNLIVDKSSIFRIAEVKSIWGRFHFYPNIDEKKNRWFANFASSSNSFDSTPFVLQPQKETIYPIPLSQRTYV